MKGISLVIVHSKLHFFPNPQIVVVVVVVVFAYLTRTPM